MTTNSRLHGVVVGHGSIAASMVDAVVRITGDAEGLIAISNDQCDRGSLEQRVADAVGTSPALVFVDMAAGSCLLAVLRRLRGREDVEVVTGVNLAMLVDFMYHRDISPDAAARRASETGTHSIKVP
jgi:mannose/fructose-specific phosphotransferase system component IIA